MTRLLSLRAPEGLIDQSRSDEMSRNSVKIVHSEDEKFKISSEATSGTSSSDKQSPKISDIVTIQQMIDLTDKPIRLTRDEINWSHVKSNASNCICCCANNSITLVTTDDSYVLDHIPLDNIEAAQADPSLQYLALANEEKLAVIDLVENKLSSPKLTGVRPSDFRSRLLSNGASSPRASPECESSKTRFVNLSVLGLTMSDVLFWRWLDGQTLTLVSRDALYTCQLDQIQINHPATTALMQPLNQWLSLTRVCDLEPNLGQLCQITDVHRDASTNLYAISGLYSAPTRGLSPSEPSYTQLQSNDSHSHHHSHNHNNDHHHHNHHHHLLVKSHHDSNSNNNNNNNHNNNNNINNTLRHPNQLAARGGGLLRRNFSSVPGRLSQMANLSNYRLTDAGNGKAQNSSAISSLRRKISSSSSKFKNSPTTTTMKMEAIPNLEGLVQIYCKLRDRVQIIQAHAIAFTSRFQQLQDLGDSDGIVGYQSTTLIAALRFGNEMKVYFIGMATSDDLTTSGQNVARSIKLDQTRGSMDPLDIPTAIVCSTLTPEDDRTHVAMIVTKHGHMFLCSITQGSILMDVQVSHDLLSGALLESKSRGLMLICRNGQVLLVRIDDGRLRQMLDETSTLRHVPSQSVFNSINHDHMEVEVQQQPNIELSEPLNMGLEVIISTKL